MGSKPSKQDPFARAESWLRQRRDAKIDLKDASLSSLVVSLGTGVPRVAVVDG